MTWRNGAVLAVVTALTGAYYLWAARSVGYPLDWNKDDPGYYNLLGRGFASGHLYVPVEPDPKLLALPNPWDPHLEPGLKMFDAVLYKRRYYLYHGAAPAVLLFAPYRLLTNKDLPESFGLFLFCVGGFLFSAGAFFTILRLAGVGTGIPFTAAALLGLAFCQGAPFLMGRVWVYEVAVGSAYFFVSGAVFFLTRSMLAGSRWMLAISGLMFGISVACRPHFLIAGLLALGVVALQDRKRLLAFAGPLVMVGLLIAWYNFARFGNPLEFGNKWQLAGENQGQLQLSRVNILPGLYYQLLVSPKFSPVFPWVELAWPIRNFPRPNAYFLEQTAGGLFLAPFIVAFPLAFFAGRARSILTLVSGIGLGLLLFVVLTGWSTQRYEMDFLPQFGLAALGGLAVIAASLPRLTRIGLTGLLIACVLFGLIVNLALGISGPYWEIVKNKPARFVRIASWFSPIPRYKPLLNPSFHFTFPISTVPAPEHLRDQWLTAGRFPYQYELYTERIGAKSRILSSFAGETVASDFPESGLPAQISVESEAASQEVVIYRNGAEILRQKIGSLVTAPSQILTPHVR